MILNSKQTGVLKDFCALILCGHDEAVFQRCKECLETAEDEYGGIPAMLYVFSGHDIDPDDPFGNIADEQLVEPQSYLISSDAGAPALEDFFWFVENLKAARGLDFAVDEESFSDDNCIVEWLAELAGQLKSAGLSIVNFDGASEDYHFTVMNHEDCEKAMDLFARLTAHIDGYPFGSSVITKDFQG